FRENLVHIGSLRRITLNGRRLSAAPLAEQFGFLHEASGNLPLTNGVAVIDMAFADAVVYGVYLNRLHASGPVRVTLTTSQSPAVNAGTRVVIENDQGPWPREIEFASPVASNAVRVTVQSLTVETTDVWLEDLRVQGQTRR